MSIWFLRRKKRRTKGTINCYVTEKAKIKEMETEVIVEKIKDALEKSVKKEIVFLCVGTDRSTGDSLGPLVGTMLKEKTIPYDVYGTLEQPVHALNLEEMIRNIYKKYENPLIFGIDACLGEKQRIGLILFEEEPFIPGKALNKGFSEVGDVHLRAIVNYLDPLSPAQTLNNTRLYTVINLAKTITDIICLSIQSKRIE
ncbi:hypothetical protein AC623_04480 [Bacillus sp. FJAT-27231]|uniref:spore protease YyaC n=1 Tax=Bacillus sp. FJAT-27231 TaxID=1679168 RepID=UPI000670765F|nr:spore protease YyaC [Bacillus sp. FJAT-27231]KMY53339.1 hypothetical protein AC623_04480 [Bacillus sp. FJAT-27231]